MRDAAAESLQWNSVQQHEGTINLYETVAGTQPCDWFTVVEMMSLSDRGDFLCANLRKWQAFVMSAYRNRNRRIHDTMRTTANNFNGRASDCVAL